MKLKIINVQFLKNWEFLNTKKKKWENHDKNKSI